MTSLISTEHDSDRGRAKIMAVAFLDYKRYFSNSERTLLAKLSTFMRQKCGSENRQVLEAYYTVRGIPCKNSLYARNFYKAAFSRQLQMKKQARMWTWFACSASGHKSLISQALSARSAITIEA
eukprot:CAMPEP_0170455490 /NCGR_PEP_ID=MMETSP0123-20130129/3439_1 /TAXON_ID=182087 /ORGANISM="Favella ehrenbergii, Strain Fehren 1" /LENGTH=123 /DNA_ID=CAMNT_0010718649 /DNA_START=189 /DNA_END=561 /DNA_ORIENTATION=-